MLAVITDTYEWRKDDRHTHASCLTDQAEVVERPPEPVLS